MKRPIILHVDFDSFFASVEQQDNPLFRNRPIGVTATNGRTCVIAASREAKKVGIKSPSRTHDARKMCPGIIFVPAHFIRYWEISKRFLQICSNYSPVVEVFSIDEVFIDVTDTAVLFGGVYSLITELKKRLSNEIGPYITVSVGISHNKFLAKLASSMNKPNGVAEITPENLISKYQTAKLTDICGIGERIKTRLNQMGIYTLLQLRDAPLSSLKAEFGEVEGAFLNDVGMANDERPVIHYTHLASPKSIGRNYCLPQNEYDKRKILQNIYELCEEVTLKLRRLEKKAKTVGISLRGTHSIHGRYTLDHYINTGKEMFNICLKIMNHQLQGYVRQISVGVSSLEDTVKLPSSLFLFEQKQQKVLTVIDALNDKFGDHTIRNAFLLYADKLTTVPNGWMADTYERAKLAKST